MARRRQDGKNGEPADPIETGEGSAGTPQRVDRAAVRRRSEAPNMLTEEELQERQKKLRETRRSVRLPGGTATRRRGARADEAPADVPETDCADPPA